MLLCTSRCSSPGRQSSVSKTSTHSSNIFFLKSRSPVIFLFVIFMPCIFSYPWSLFTFRVTKRSARLANAKTGICSLLDSLHISYPLRHMVSWLIHHSFAISIYFLKVWVPSWSSLQTIEYELKLHHAPLSILHSTTLLLLFVFISISTTRRVFFVSTFAISSLMMYVDWITLHYSSEYFSSCNWDVAFCLQTLAKWFFFPRFPHLSAHAEKSSGDICFPFLPQYPQDAFLSPLPPKSSFPWLSVFLSE